VAGICQGQEGQSGPASSPVVSTRPLLPAIKSISDEQLRQIILQGKGKMPPNKKLDDEKKVFQDKCTPCHGLDGAGKTTMGMMLKIPDLRSDDVQKQTDADLNRIITKGKNKMPAFDGKLKKEQIEKLVGYIRELGKKQ
jgi:cytochrome c